MTLQFTISPDLNPKATASWFLLCRCFSRLLEQPCCLRLFNDFDGLDRALQNDEIDLIYADPLSMAFLVREKDYLPVAQAKDCTDEVLVVVNNRSAVQSVDDFRYPMAVATTRVPDVQAIGCRLLGANYLLASDLSISTKPSPAAVAKAVLQNEVDAGFFLRETFDAMSALVRSLLRPVASGQIQAARHAFLVRPRYAHLKELLLEGFESMRVDPQHHVLLRELGLAHLSRMSFEEAEMTSNLLNNLQG